MTDRVYPGARLSYSGALCTVRYIGPVSSTKGDWLGVEWDDSNRGKHDGSHGGVKYFDCQGISPTAASFVRPSRPTDKALSFLEAFREKYASDDSKEGLPVEHLIEIGGKTVQEVGFDKIRKQLAVLHELQIVILDGLRIAGIEARPWIASQELQLQEWQRIQDQQLKIVELDLSRNLLEKWANVMCICSTLKSLQTLKLDGNRFNDLSIPTPTPWPQPFQTVKELSLNSTFLSWSQIVHLTTAFPSLIHLSASSNSLSSLSTPLPTPHLTHLTLSSNLLSSLSALSPLTHLPRLKTLILRYNPIIPTPTTPAPFKTISALDLSRTLLPTPQSLDPLATTFPTLKSLLTTHTPLSITPSSSLLTTARLATLTSLNHSPITPPERQDAELFYLSLIARQLSAAVAEDELRIVAEHPRYRELCALHGAPEVVRHGTHEVTKGTLAERVVRFKFYLLPSSIAAPTGETIIEKTAEIPRTVSVYMLKGAVGRLLGIRPLSCRLVYETGEWDPVGGAEGEEWSCGESDDEEDDDGHHNGIESRRVGGDDEGDEKKGKWIRREVELIDSTREIGFWIEGREAKVRVELR